MHMALPGYFHCHTEAVRDYILSADYEGEEKLQYKNMQL